MLEQKVDIRVIQALLGHKNVYGTISSQRERGNIDDAWRIGTDAASAAILRALDDGADLPRDQTMRPKPRPGMWHAAPPVYINDPVEPRAPEWRARVLKTASDVEPPTPVEYGTHQYWAEVAEVRRVAAGLTPRQKQIAEDWNLDLGTVTPAGVCNVRARRLAQERTLDDAQTGRLLAALNIAMADALVAAWHAKYRWWTQRPVTAIREKPDPNFMPHIVTPPFPSYVSGHAAISGATSALMSAFFPDNAAQFLRDAEEAARSRRYGGIHSTSDNNEGLKLGQRVGALVVARLVKP